MSARRRRMTAGVVLLLIALVLAVVYPQSSQPPASAEAPPPRPVPTQTPDSAPAPSPIEPDYARALLDKLEIKGRAAKTDYRRSQFGDGWGLSGSCDVRNVILKRDMRDTTEANCKIQTGALDDPYTGKTIQFMRGADTSDDVQIDHVVALSDAWQKGAQQLSVEERIRLANDPLELLAVDGDANQQKGSGDAATWLPPNKTFRCQYVARQVAVKYKYRLWVTQAEHDAMARVLDTCPEQRTPIAKVEPLHVKFMV